MNKQQASSERRHFGRRWTQVHGWICIEGRPKISCLVQNLSETGALLDVGAAKAGLPKHFVLNVEAIKFRIGCEVARDAGASIGVRFMPEVDVPKDMTVQRSAAEASSYQRLLDLANEEKAEIERRQHDESIQRLLGVTA